MRSITSGTILGFAAIFFIMFLFGCEKNAELTDDEKIQGYLKANDIDALPTASGLYYIEYIEGQGNFPVSLDTVEVTYVGGFLNGQVFESTSSEFTVDNDQVIKGWDEGIKYMRKGGKALLIVPSKLGYGEYGKYPTIPGNIVLLFTINLDNIRNGPNH